jgi:hypothetical protein
MTDSENLDIKVGDIVWFEDGPSARPHVVDAINGPTLTIHRISRLRAWLIGQVDRHIRWVEKVKNDQSS